MSGQQGKLLYMFIRSTDSREMWDDVHIVTSVFPQQLYPPQYWTSQLMVGTHN